MQKEKKPIFFFDSGAGGLPYFRYFHERNPSEPVIYIADRTHFPYGVKTKEEITAILLDLAEKSTSFFQPEIAVLACNTATVSALPALREKFGAVSWVGTVPAVKPAVLGSKSRCAGVLGTDRTIEDPYIAELAEKYGADVKLIRLAAPDLVDFAEHKGADAPESEKRRVIFPYIEKFRENGADALVLGCTHFLLLLDSFRELASPDIAVYDSLEGVTRRVESLLQKSDKSGELSLIEGGKKIDIAKPIESEEECLKAMEYIADQLRDMAGLIVAEIEQQEKKGKILLTGDAPIEPVWKKRAEDFGMDISLLDELIGS